ncbi:hypothetical protein FGADI_675 [Fusarium gaditjirri]|uniref:F-box domain-containing protein n=1 Tax=Fusarium gaditjirri TaxID=282569 RepID=A0A8H4X3Q7_9HYPO|nr:hypothetical protein FGADI_675 [Fusarium gaditjirri]
MKFDVSRDFRSLMIGKPAPTKADNFGRESNRLRSILLDKVMQGRPRASSSKLLQLPAEILAEIADLLSDDTESLSSLFGVNSDCRQLACCSYLTEVNFDYGLDAKDLVSHYVENKLLKYIGGPCIRKATFASQPQHVADTHRELYDTLYGKNAERVTDEQLQVLYNEACEEYVATRAATVKAISSLPNLETLIWKDQYSLDKGFFEKITRCSARQVELDGPAIDDAWSLTPPLTPSTWPLTSLKLDVSLAQDKWNEIKSKGETGTHHMAPFFSSLFRLCAPTLESLTWSYSGVTREDEALISIGENAVSFPRLRYLRLQFVKLDSVAISSFLAAPLRSLDLDDKVLNNPSTLDCEPLRDLEDFVVSHPPNKASVCRRIAKFISQHTGLRRLCLRENLGGTKYLNDGILPTLTSLDFRNLSSLYLAGGRSRIPDKPLRMIGQLVSLEQLGLSAGSPFEFEHWWDVDHDKLRHRLSPLQRFTKLALVHDTYPVAQGDDLPSGFYYLLRSPPESLEEANARPELDMEENGRRWVGMFKAWDRAHRNRMLTEAEKYAAVFPELEWVYSGQWSMGIIRTPEGQCGLPKAIPLTKKRDQCRTYQEAIFGDSCYMDSDLSEFMD